MLSRCYPTISDLIFDFTGFTIPLPIFTFGFFVALSFMVGAWILSIELKRKEALGLLHPYNKEVIKGAGITPFDILVSGILGFLLGFKIVLLLLNYEDFAKNPQAILLSPDGSLIGGIVGAIVMAIRKYRQQIADRLETPVKSTVVLHPYQQVGDIIMIAAISGIAGAKLFYLFESPGNFTEFIQNPLGTFFGGLTIYGGLIVGAISVAWYVWKRGMSPVHIADANAPVLFLGYGIGRQGCALSGDGDWGIVNTLTKPEWLSWLPDRLWAFDYPHNILNQGGVFIEGCKEASCYVLKQAVFPTPTYETITAFFLFAFVWMIRKKVTVPGLMISLYLILNGIERFFIEKIRVNTKIDFFGMDVTQAEIFAVIFIMTGVMAGIYFTLKHKRNLKS